MSYPPTPANTRRRAHDCESCARRNHQPSISDNKECITVETQKQVADFLQAAISASERQRAIQEAKERAAREALVEAMRRALPAEIAEALHIDFSTATGDETQRCAGYVCVDGVQINLEVRAWHSVAGRQAQTVVLQIGKADAWEIQKLTPENLPAVVGMLIQEDLKIRNKRILEEAEKRINWAINWGTEAETIEEIKRFIASMPDACHGALRSRLAERLRKYTLPSRRAARRAAVEHERLTRQMDDLRPLAEEFAAIFNAWQEAGRLWAEEWTTRLWRPVSLWRVRYAPMLRPVDYDAETNDLIKSFVTSTNPAFVVRSHACVAVHSDGEMGDFYFGAFLDAVRVPQEERTITGWMVYYRSHRWGQWFVNVPFDEELRPPRAPDAPEWPQFVADRRPDLLPLAEKLGYTGLLAQVEED